MKKGSSRPNGLLAVFATFLVVGGVVAVAFVASPHSPSPKKDDGTGSGQPPKAANNSPLLLVDGTGARLFKDGEMKNLKWPDDVKLLGKAVSMVHGVDVSTGEGVALANGFVVSTSSAINSPDGRRSVQSGERRKDGTSSLEVRLGNDVRTFVLRLPNGRGIRDAKPLGWWDNDTVALTGLSTSSRAVYSLKLTGTAREVAQLPEFIQHVRIMDGSVWYVQVTPGEGLEQAPIPPSELRRISPAGKETKVAAEEGKLIIAYTVSHEKAIYETEDANMMLVEGDAPQQFGNGTPLVILPDGRVLLRQGEKLILKDPVTGLADAFVTVSDGMAIFALDIDETEKTP